MYLVRPILILFPTMTPPRDREGGVYGNDVVDVISCGRGTRAEGGRGEGEEEGRPFFDKAEVEMERKGKVEVVVVAVVACVATEAL